MSDKELISLEWLQEVASRTNANVEFKSAAGYLDSWIQLVMGERKFSIKIFMGEIIRVLPGSVAFGHAFTLRGDGDTWHSLIPSGKPRLREMMATGKITTEGNLFEGMRSTKAVALLVDAAREVGFPADRRH